MYYYMKLVSFLDVYLFGSRLRTLAIILVSDAFPLRHPLSGSLRFEHLRLVTKASITFQLEYILLRYIYCLSLRFEHLRLVTKASIILQLEYIYCAPNTRLPVPHKPCGFCGR